MLVLSILIWGLGFGIMSTQAMPFQGEQTNTSVQGLGYLSAEPVSDAPDPLIPSQLRVELQRGSHPMSRSEFFIGVINALCEITRLPILAPSPFRKTYYDYRLPRSARVTFENLVGLSTNRIVAASLLVTMKEVKQQSANTDLVLGLFMNDRKVATGHIQQFRVFGLGQGGNSSIDSGSENGTDYSGAPSDSSQVVPVQAAKSAANPSTETSPSVSATDQDSQLNFIFGRLPPLDALDEYATYDMLARTIIGLDYVPQDAPIGTSHTVPGPPRGPDLAFQIPVPGSIPFPTLFPGEARAALKYMAVNLYNGGRFTKCHVIIQRAVGHGRIITVGAIAVYPRWSPPADLLTVGGNRTSSSGRATQAWAIPGLRNPAGVQTS